MPQRNVYYNGMNKISFNNIIKQAEWPSASICLIGFQFEVQIVGLSFSRPIFVKYYLEQMETDSLWLRSLKY